MILRSRRAASAMFNFHRLVAIMLSRPLCKAQEISKSVTYNKRLCLIHRAVWMQSPKWGKIHLKEGLFIHRLAWLPSASRTSWVQITKSISNRVHLICLQFQGIGELRKRLNKMRCTSQINVVRFEMITIVCSHLKIRNIGLCPQASRDLYRIHCKRNRRWILASKLLVKALLGILPRRRVEELKHPLLRITCILIQGLCFHQWTIRRSCLQQIIIRLNIRDKSVRRNQELNSRFSTTREDESTLKAVGVMSAWMDFHRHRRGTKEFLSRRRAQEACTKKRLRNNNKWIEECRLRRCSHHKFQDCHI